METSAGKIVNGPYESSWHSLADVFPTLQGSVFAIFRVHILCKNTLSGSMQVLQQRWQRGIDRPLQKGFPFVEGFFIV